MRRADMISGGLVAVFGLVMIYAVVPWQIESSGDYGLDPKFFPVALLWLVTVMGVLLVLTRMRQPQEPEGSPEAAPVLDRNDWKFIVGSCAFLAIAFIAIDMVGYVIAGMLIIAILMFALQRGRPNWLELAITSIAAPITIYLLLYHLFSVQLPAGPLFQ